MRFFMRAGTKKRVFLSLRLLFLVTFAPNMKNLYNTFFAVSSAFLFVMCSAGNASQPDVPVNSVPSAVPSFNADSAYSYVAQQLDFGPRVPGSEAQQKAAVWLQEELKRHGATVYVQNTEAKAYTEQILPIINIIGTYNPEAKVRVLLMSHWDSRHICDEDPDKSKRNNPVDGANDGASGVGVLLEIARQAGLKNPKVGIDIFLCDAEDYGAPDDFSGQHREDWWALGTQAWCKNPHIKGYRANYGILLDMVGAKDATFYYEYYSKRYAEDVVTRVWGIAQNLGFGNYFIPQNGAGITDDHVFVNRMTGIPTIDIIDTRADGNGTFYPYWHTSGDTLDKIDRETLKAVGTVLMNLIY